MNKIKILTLTTLAASVLMAGSVSSVFAANDVVICHVLSNPHQTLSVNQNAVQAHLNHGDSLGACQTPVVPEFGLLTGIVALALSSGSYFLLKRKTSK